MTVKPVNYGSKVKNTEDGPLEKVRATVGYIGVSLFEKQAVQGVSLAAQEARIRAFAAAGDRNISHVIADAGETGKSLKRPGITELLEAVKGGTIGSIIVYKLDRLTRSLKDLMTVLELLEKHNVALVSICENFDTGTPVGQFTLHLLGAIGQLEVKQIAERTRFALAYKRQCGKVYARVAFGFERKGDTLIPKADEQLALRSISKMRRDGATLRSIGAWLSENGFQPKHGGSRWHPATIRKMLQSAATRDILAASKAPSQ